MKHFLLGVLCGAIVTAVLIAAGMSYLAQYLGH